MVGRIAFEPLATAHIPLMYRWLNDGPVLEWYARRPRSYRELAYHYGRMISGASKTRPYLIRIDGQPAGMIKTYALGDYADYCAACGAEPHWFGIDYFLGEFRGRRLASPMIERFLEEVVFTETDVCISGPDPANERSIRALRGAGFSDLREIEIAGDHEFLLIRKSVG